MIQTRNLIPFFLTTISACVFFIACAKKQMPEGNVKGISKFQLNGGAAISQPGVDEYNPQVLQQGDNYLALVFASNRTCGGCSGHNLFIARSVSAYNNDAVFPAFETPVVITIGGTPLNYTNPVAFAATLTGNNVRIFLTNAGGNVQQTGAITPGGSSDTTLTNIANIAGLNSSVVGVEFTGSKLYAQQGGTLYSFDPVQAAGALTAMATGHNATSVASVDSAFTSRYDGFFSLINGTIAGMSLYGMGGNVEKVNTAIAKARLSTRFISVMRGGGFNGGLMFISGIESGGTTQDLYVVDGLTVWQMWQALNPKPPGAPNGGSTPVETTATADPAYSPVAGHYGMPVNVTITSTTSGATVCYTTDGVTDPVCSATATCSTGTTYASAVSVSYTTTNFRARACKAGLTDSAVVSATHVSDATQPTTPGSPNADGTTSSQVQVQWAQATDNATAQAQIVYEICQTTVNGGCNTFTTTFTSSAAATSYNSNGLSASTTYYYRIRSRDLAGNTSGYTAQVSATTLAGPTVNAPSFSPVAGTFNTAQNVTISTTTGSSILCYSTDGSTPACDATPSCTTGNLYSSAVNIAATATLRAIGCRSGYTNSTVTAGTYTIDTVAPVISATAPASSSSPTNTQVSFTFSEACASGSVTWTRTGGTADALSPHVKTLVGAELSSGAHNNITITNNPTLTNGSVYSVQFNCTDAAGNAATAVTNTAVTFSGAVTPPRMAETNGVVSTMALSGTTLYIGGNFTYVGRNTGYGAILSSAGSGTLASGVTQLAASNQVFASAPDGAGGWYIAGTFTNIGSTGRNRIARINADGTLHPWNPDVNNTVNTLSVSGNTVYIGGSFTAVDGQGRNGVAALDTTVNTNTVTSFNPNVSGQVKALALSGSTLYIGGGFTTLNAATSSCGGGAVTRNRIAAINTSDGCATAWNPNASGGATDVEAIIVAGATIYIGGGFSTLNAATSSCGSGSLARNRIAALNASDGCATAWNPTGNNTVYTMVLSGTTLYAGGLFTSIGGTGRQRIAALDTTINTSNATSWNPVSDGVVYSLHLSGTTLYAGGGFTLIGGQVRNSLVALDTTINTNNATSWNPTPENQVRTISVSGSNIYVGGDFTMIAGAMRNRIAAIDTTTGSVTAWNPNADNLVNAIVVSGNTVYAGGSFSQVSGQTRNAIAAIDATVNTNNVTAWNPNASSSVNALAISGTTLYAGGNFSNIGGQTRGYIAALDTTVNTNNATAWNPNAGTAVSTLTISGTTVYAGGSFTTMNAATSSCGGGVVTRNRIAAINVSDGCATAWNPNADGQINAMVVSGTTMYALGAFSNIGGQARNRLAALDTTVNTGMASAWNPNANNTVYTGVLSGTTLYVGGAVSTVGGQTRNYIAALDTTINFANATSFNPNATNLVRSMVLSGQTLFVGGQFSGIGGQVRYNLAAIDTTTGTAY